MWRKSRLERARDIERVLTVQVFVSTEALHGGAVAPADVVQTLQERVPECENKRVKSRCESGRKVR
jgi:hypothetical protein